MLENTFSSFASVLVSHLLFIKLFFHPDPTNTANKAEKAAVLSVVLHPSLR